METASGQVDAQKGQSINYEGELHRRIETLMGEDKMVTQLRLIISTVKL